MDLQLRNSKVVLCGATGLLGKTIALELARGRRAAVAAGRAPRRGVEAVAALRAHGIVVRVGHCLRASRLIYVVPLTA